VATRTYPDRHDARDRADRTIETIGNATSLTQIVEDVLDVSRTSPARFASTSTRGSADVVRRAIDVVTPAADAGALTSIL
jgi:hypothetical protein